MKKFWMILVCVLLVVLLITVIRNTANKSFDDKSDNDESNDVSSNGELYINGEMIPNNDVIVYSDYMKLPLVLTLQNIGVNVEWLDNSTAELLINNAVYNLNLDERTLFKSEDNFNILQMAPGSKNYCCEPKEKEIVIDGATFNIILRFVGLRECVDVDVDYSNKKVSIQCDA